MSMIAKTRFLNKVVICTASSKGIGFEIAQRLAQEGAKVVISSRGKENVEKAVDSLKAQGLTAIGSVCHTSNADQRKKLLETAYNNFGGIDVLFSNAGVNPHIGPIFECSTEQWDKCFEGNVRSHFLLTKEVLPYLEKRGGGNIVYMSSFLGIVPLDILGAYCVSKGALLSLTKAGAQSLASKNIRINCIAPAHINTEFSQIMRDDSHIRKKISSVIAMKRFGEVHEVNGAAAFIASDDASYITGEILVVNGGIPSKV